MHHVHGSFTELTNGHTFDTCAHALRVRTQSSPICCSRAAVRSTPCAALSPRSCFRSSLTDPGRWALRTRRGGWAGSEGAEVISAVEGQLRAREPDLGAGRLSFLSAFSHMECEILDFPPQTVTPLSPGRGGARGGAAGVRDVCGPESDMPCPPCFCFITSVRG